MATISVDPTWRRLYRTGGPSLCGVGIIDVTGAVLSVLIGPAPLGEAYLQALASHATVARLNFGLFVVLDLLLIPGSIALYFGLEQIDRPASIVATGLITVYAVFDLGVTELNSLTLVSLAQQVVVGRGEAQRAAATAASQYGLTMLPIATSLSFLVSSIGFLVASVLVLEGGFGRGTAYLGIAASLLGVVGSAYVVDPAASLAMMPSLVIAGGWAFLVGTRLFRLGGVSDADSPHRI